MLKTVSIAIISLFLANQTTLAVEKKKCYKPGDTKIYHTGETVTYHAGGIVTWGWGKTKPKSEGGDKNPKYNGESTYTMCK